MALAIRVLGIRGRGIRDLNDRECLVVKNLHLEERKYVYVCVLEMESYGDFKRERERDRVREKGRERQ